MRITLLKRAAMVDDFKNKRLSDITIYGTATLFIPTSKMRFSIFVLPFHQYMMVFVSRRYFIIQPLLDLMKSETQLLHSISRLLIYHLANIHKIL